MIILIDRSVSSVELRAWWENLVAVTDLPHIFLDGLLAFMLFAGSLHVDMDSLRAQKWTVLSLATVGVLMATALYGSVSARASLYSWLDEGEIFQAASNTLKTVAVRRSKWNLR